MEKNSNIDKEEKKINLEENNKDSRKKKIVILLVVIFILSLVTTGLTTNIFGRIGTAFRNEGTFVLKHTDDNDKEVVKNQALKFDSKYLDISLSDTSGKLSYSYNHIVPSEFTCETSDADVATCYPADGYVVVYPKGEGKTTVTIRTEANGKIYAATSEVTVGEAERYIELSSYEGIINLNTNKKKDIAYYLVGMSGDVKVSSSNESVAKAKVENGVVKITASKVGKVDITVSITYNDKTYTNVYKLEVINQAKNQDEKPVVRKKSRISTLSKLTSSNGELKFNPAITNYSILVNKDVKTIDIDFEKTNENARTIYSVDGMATTTLKNIPLRDGASEVIITVISEDGSSTTTYKIAINRVEDEMVNSIMNVTVNGKVLAASAPNNYSLRVDTDVETVDLALNLNTDNVTVKYIIDNKIMGDGNVLKDIQLKLGRNTIKFIVRNKFGINMVCFVTIEREAPSTNTNIDVTVDDDGYELNKIDDNNYKVPNVPYEKDKMSFTAACEDSNCTSISYEITYADGTKKTLDDLKDVELKEGNNKIAITVVAEDGTTKDTHYINIYRPIRTIEFKETENKVLVEKDYTDIPFSIIETAEDGTKTTVELDNTSDVMNAELEKYNSEDDVVLEVHQGFVRVIPKNSRKIVGKEDTLTLTYGDKEVTTKVSFDIDEYELSGNKNFDMTNSKAGNTRAIILNTNLVSSTDKELSIERSDDGKKLTICDKDKVYCVEVTVDSTKDDGKVTLTYGKDSTSEIGPNDLPITITAEGDGESIIHVSGSVYGKSINKDFDIIINVTRKYKITIYANLPDEEGAKFNAATKEWTDEISKDEIMDLRLIPEPYKIEECKYYEFSHFTSDPSNPAQQDYDRYKNAVINGSKLKDDLTLYAVYENKPSDKKPPETNSLWLKADDYTDGLPLFHNEDYYTKYNEDKVIYPGAEGSYVMNFVAEDDMNIIGLTLKENTICISGKCLNMGYMVHYNEIRYKNPVDGKDYETIGKDFVGKKADKSYWILNQNYGIMNGEVTYLDENNQKQTLDAENRADIKFDEAISMKSGDQISITIFWKWVGDDDEADTAIGEYVANEGASINDKYALSVGVIYEPVDACATTD